MPKDRNVSRLSSGSQSSRYKPYSRYGPSGAQETCSTDGEDAAERKEWEEATCPVCMEHPHNAVLLICSSYGKGCRPYMCDTSYRHSNCLDQYRKAHELRDALPLGSVRGRGVAETERAVVNRVEDSEDERGPAAAPAPAPGLVVRSLGAGGIGGDYRRETSVEVDGARDGGLGQVSVEVGNNGVVPGEEVDSGELLCPLCRGKVKGWKVVEAARSHLNQKLRSCAQESCNYSGPYEELRKHARCTHPLARPSEIDRSRLDRWMQLERQRERGDVLSTMPGATVFGDYVIEGDENGDDEDGDDTDFPGDDGNWWTVFLLFQVFGQSSMAGGRGLPASMVRGRFHPPRNSAARSALWGEAMAGNNVNRLGGNPPGNGENIGGGVGSRSHRRRSRERGRGHADRFPARRVRMWRSGGHRAIFDPEYNCITLFDLERRADREKEIGWFYLGSASAISPGGRDGAARSSGNHILTISQYLATLVTTLKQLTLGAQSAQTAQMNQFRL